MKNEKLYDIIPSQDCMYLMHKFSLHKQMAQIPTSFLIGMQVDFELLQKALDMVLPKFDGFNMRLRRGVFRHYFEESGKQAPLVFSAAIFLGTLIIGDRRARMELQRRFYI